MFQRKGLVEVDVMAEIGAQVGGTSHVWYVKFVDRNVNEAFLARLNDSGDCPGDTGTEQLLALRAENDVNRCPAVESTVIAGLIDRVQRLPV
jgi:hypothetical protein